MNLAQSMTEPPPTARIRFPVLPNQVHAFEDLVESQVRGHAGEFDDLVAGLAQRGRHIVIGTVALDRAAAVDQQHAAPGRDLASSATCET